MHLSTSPNKPSYTAQFTSPNNYLHCEQVLKIRELQMEKQSLETSNLHVKVPCFMLVL
jgi:hypothetical protein